MVDFWKLDVPSMSTSRKHKKEKEKEKNDGKIEKRKMVDTLLNLVDGMAKLGQNDIANRIKLVFIRSRLANRSKLRKIRTRPKKTLTSSQSKEVTNIQNPMYINKAKFSNFHPKEIAKHLTLLDFSIYQSIDTSEFVSKNWSSNPEKAKNLCTIIRRSNEISQWVATLILKQPSTSLRRTVIMKLITVGQYCQQYANFNGVMAIISGFTMWPVQRILKDVSLSRQYVAMFSFLRNICAPAENFKSYRQELRRRYEKLPKSPAMPYVGVFLRDLTLIEDGNADFISDLINYEKLSQVGEILATIKKFQNSNYTEVYESINPQLLRYVSCLHFYTEARLNELSTKLKPLSQALIEAEVSSSISFNSETEEGDSGSEISEKECEDIEDFSSDSATSLNAIYLPFVNQYLE